MRASKAYWGYDIQQMEVWKEELTISPSYIQENQVFSLWSNGKIIGFYSYFEQEDHIKLDNLFLLPAFIGKGLGYWMMEDFLKRVASIPKDKIVLDADPHAEGFYLKLGFQTISWLPSSIPKRFLPTMMKPNSE